MFATIKEYFVLLQKGFNDKTHSKYKKGCNHPSPQYKHDNRLEEISKLNQDCFLNEKNIDNSEVYCQYQLKLNLKLS